MLPRLHALVLDVRVGHSPIAILIAFGLIFAMRAMKIPLVIRLIVAIGFYAAWDFFIRI